MIVPFWVKAVIVLAIGVGVIVGVRSCVEHIKDIGRAEVQAAWDAQNERAAKEIIRLREIKNKVTTVVETKYVDRVKIIQEKGDAITKEVKVYVPMQQLSGAFRVYYDAAVENRVPNPAEIPNAAPTTSTEVAETTSENFKLCHVAYETVDKWRAWAEGQCKLNSKGCQYE